MHLAEGMGAHLRQTPLLTRLAVAGGSLALATTARLSTGRALHSLPPDERAAVLQRVANWGGDPAAALEGLKSLVLLAHGSAMASEELRERAQRHPPVRTDPHLNVVSSAWWPSTSVADVVVVGSGAGGAMAARTLAGEGMNVVIVEEGRRWGVAEFRDRPPIERYAGLYREAGTTVAIGRPPVVMPIGRGVGGTTLVNSGTCIRPPVSVLRRWRDDFGLALADADRFDHYLAEVEAVLGVAPVTAETMGRNGQLLLDGAARLNWRSEPMSRNAHGCVANTQCALGCPSNAKAGVHLNALPDACASGATIVSEARVERVLTDRGRAKGVAVRRPDGSRLSILAPQVVVAAGATESPLLLHRSGLGRHRQVGRNLTVHPAVSLAARFADPVRSWEGVLQSAVTDQFHDTDGILVEATAMPPGMGSLALPGFGAELLRRMAEADHYASMGAMIADGPSGRVRSLGGRTLIRYDLAREDAAKLTKAIVVMARSMFAAGATEVVTGVNGVPDLRSGDEVEKVVADLDIRRLHLAAFHPAGTLRAGSDAERCPVDAIGRVRGVAGIWVADASILPTCPEVNPQISIMALALAVADQVVEQRHRRD